MPLAILPFSADQPFNARRVADRGAGIALADAGDVAEAVPALLAEPGSARAAGGIAREIAALPPVSEATRLLDGLALATSAA